MHIDSDIYFLFYCKGLKRSSEQRTMVAEEMEVSNRQNLARWIADGWISAVDRYSSVGIYVAWVFTIVL